MDTQDRAPVKLFTPGPVGISREARDALVRPAIHHRSHHFERVLADLMEGLKTAFQTQDDVAVLTSSGTGAMEAVITNLFGPGDGVMVPVAGKFSARWAEMSEAYGIRVYRMDLRPGESPQPDAIADSVKRNPDIKGVMLTHCETATGSLTDLRSVSQAIGDIERSMGQTILICVDAISSLCVDEFRKDQWRIDCAIGASQKGLLSPPGLAFVCLNDRALRCMRKSKVPRYYFDLAKYYEGGSASPFTPATSLVCAVKDSLDRIISLGLENVWRASRSAASAVTLLIEAAGFRPVAANGSSVLTAFWVDDVSAEEMARILLKEHGIMVAQGQQELKGKILRVSAIGKSRSEILSFARAFEATMVTLGKPFVLSDVADRLEDILEESRLWE